MNNNRGIAAQSAARGRRWTQTNRPRMPLNSNLRSARRARRVRRARRPAASLPAAGEENFIPKSAKPTRNQRFLRCHSDFLAEPSGWILRFLDVTKTSKDPAKITDSIFDPTRRNLCYQEAINHYSLTPPPPLLGPPLLRPYLFIQSCPAP